MNCMPSLDVCNHNAGRYAQEIVNAWVNHRAGNASPLTDEFNILRDLACDYQDAQKAVAKHQWLIEKIQDPDDELNAQLEEARTTETRTRQAFAEAYKGFEDKHVAATVP
jgi:hypothetical protein